jgi:hypothetical protein
VLAFSAEALFQVLLCDISRVLNIEVVEGKRQVGLCDFRTFMQEILWSESSPTAPARQV